MNIFVIIFGILTIGDLIFYRLAGDESLKSNKYKIPLAGYIAYINHLSNKR